MQDNPMFTILVKECTMKITADPFFEKSTITNARNLFRQVFAEPWRNTETIELMAGYLAGKVEEALEMWRLASLEYQNKYIDVKFQPRLTEPEKRDIEDANKRLAAGVKRAKSRCDRFQKLLTYFNRHRGVIQ